MSKLTEVNRRSRAPLDVERQRCRARLRSPRHRDPLADRDQRRDGRRQSARPSIPCRRASSGWSRAPFRAFADSRTSRRRGNRCRDDDAVAAIGELGRRSRDEVVDLVVRAPRVRGDVGDREAGTPGHAGEDSWPAATGPRATAGRSGDPSGWPRMSSYDYVIVGAGSAGCLLAAPAQRGPERERAPDRGRRPGPLAEDQDPRRLRPAVPDEARLELRDRARARLQRPAPLRPARQEPRRLELDERDALRPRLRRRL